MTLSRRRYGAAWAGLSLKPRRGVWTLAGAPFGLAQGTVLVSFASTAGALLSFLLARTLLRDLCKRNFSAQLAHRGGACAVMACSTAQPAAVPVFPFFLINLVMGLTDCGLPYTLHQPDRHAARHDRVR